MTVGLREMERERGRKKHSPSSSRINMTAAHPSFTRPSYYTTTGCLHDVTSDVVLYSARSTLHRPHRDDTPSTPTDLAYIRTQLIKTCRCRQHALASIVRDMTTSSVNFIVLEYKQNVITRFPQFYTLL